MYVFIGKVPTNIQEIVEKQSVDRKLTKAETKAITKVYGENWICELGLDQKFNKYVIINELVYDNDTLLTLKYKLSSYCGKQKLSNIPPRDMYMWSESQSVNLKFFVKNLYNDRPFVTGKVLKTSFYFFTKKKLDVADDLLMNIQQAWDVVQSYVKKVKRVMEPVTFKYLHNGAFIYFPANPLGADSTTWELSVSDFDGVDVISGASLCIEALNAKDRTMYIILARDIPDAIRPIYFPTNIQLPTMDIAKLKEDDIILAKVYENASNTAANVDCITNHVHFRVQDDISSINGIQTKYIFDHIFPDKEIPFMKHISSTKTTYKAYKPYLVNIDNAAPKISKADLMVWTKLDKAKNLKNNQELIVFKMLFNTDVWGTFLLYSNGTYDVKLNTKPNQTDPTLIDMVDKVNIFMKSLHKRFETDLIPLDIEFLEKPYFENGQVSKFLVSGMISSNKRTLSATDLEERLSALVPIFTHTQTKLGIISFIYKRLNQFSLRDNILQYLSRYFSDTKANLVPFIVNLFSVSEAHANDILKDWRQIKSTNKYFYKPKDMQIVMIRIKPTKVGYKFVIDGVRDQKQYNFVIQAIVGALGQGKLKTKGSKTLNTTVFQEVRANSNAILDDEDDDFAFLDMDVNDEAFFEDGADGMSKQTENTANEDDDDDNTVPDDVAEKKAAMACPVKIKSLNSQSREVGKDQDHKFILNQLYKADQALFKFESDSAMGKYAKKCQKATKRQPIVLDSKEIDYINKCFPKAVQNHQKVGSTPELTEKNMYICPQVWCPKSRVALSLDQLNNDYNGSCPFPGVKESPIILQQSNGHFNPYVGFLSPSDHPKQLCMPCCFKKPFNEKTDKCKGDDTGNDKYVVDVRPAGRDRFGVLPTKLANVFGNDSKQCKHGLMNGSTNCYFRKGIKLTDQSFLQCMASLLDADFESPEDVCKAIIDNMTMELYLSIYNGLLCRKFASLANIHIENVEDYKQFAKWFLSNKQVNYIKRFNLQSITNFITLNKKAYNPFSEWADVVKREFTIYSSYSKFIDYISDSKIPKTHDFLLDLFQRSLKWLNPKGYNILVFEVDKNDDVSIICHDKVSVINKGKNTILVMRYNKHYEPIVKVEYIEPSNKRNKKGYQSIVEHFDTYEHPIIEKLLTIYKEKCEEDIIRTNENIIFTWLRSVDSLRPKVQVIDYTFHVIGYILENGMYIPLLNGVSLKLDQESFLHATFIDVAFQQYKPKNTFEDVKKQLEQINKLVDGYYNLDSIEHNVDSAVILFADEKTFIPLKGFKMLPQNAQTDSMIYIDKELPDDRKQFIDRFVLIQKMTILLKNAILMKANNTPSLHETINILRHSHNPMPGQLKRLQMRKALKDIISDITDTYSKQSMSAKTMSVDKIKDVFCYKLESPSACNQAAPCRYVFTNGKGSCKLMLPEEEFESIFDAVVEEILNPNFPIKISKMKDEESFNSDTLLFVDKDVLNDNLDNLIDMIDKTDTFDFMTSDLPLSKALLDKVDVYNPTSDFLTGEFKTLPTYLRGKIDDFAINDNSEVYTPDWLYSLYSFVYKRINNNTKSSSEIKALVAKSLQKKAVEDFDNPSMVYNVEKLGSVKKALKSSSYYPSIDEIYMLSELCKVNTIIFNRKTLRYISNLRCVGKRDDKVYILLNMTESKQKRYDHYQLFVKDRKKILLTPFDFSKEMFKDIQKTCTSYYL